MTSNRNQRKSGSNISVEDSMFNSAVELIKENINVGAALGVLASACYLITAKHEKLLFPAMFILQFYNLLMVAHAVKGISKFRKKYTTSWREKLWVSSLWFSIFIQGFLPVVVGLFSLVSILPAIKALSQ